VTVPVPPAPPSIPPATPPAPPVTTLVPTFEMVRAQVFAVSCATCHYHQTDFSTYSDTFDERDAIQKKVLVDHTMPKTGTLSADQVNVLSLWLASGAREFPPAAAASYR